LSHLDPDQLLPEATETVSKTVAALLRSVHPLSKTELAEQADVSSRSLRNHGNLDALIALDLVRETDDGKYRFALPFATDDERSSQVYPDPVDDEFTTACDVLFEIVLATVEDPARIADPDDPIGGVFYGPELDADPLRRELPWIDPWVRVARMLCNEATSTNITVSFGASIEQTAIHLQTTQPTG
jgi:hypothetical protein